MYGSPHCPVTCWEGQPCVMLYGSLHYPPFVWVGLVSCVGNSTVHVPVVWVSLVSCVGNSTVHVPVVWVSNDSTRLVQPAGDQGLLIGAVQIHGHDDVTSSVGVEQLIVDGVHFQAVGDGVCGRHAEERVHGVSV